MTAKWTKKKTEISYWGGVYSPQHDGFLCFADSKTFEECKTKSETYRRWFGKDEPLEIRYHKEIKHIYEMK